MASSGADLSKYYPVFILTFSVLLFFPWLGERDFWAPVEPRYGEIARIMFSKSEWIVPTVNGDLYTDKPILFFWIGLVAAKIIGGVTEWTVRLPAALGGAGFVMATYFLGRDLFNDRVGAIAAIVLASSFRVIWESRWAHVDMLFGFFFLLTIYFGARTLLFRGGRNEILLSYVFMALATLAKGLIGVVLPALLFISFMIARRDWNMMRAAKLPLGLPIFLLVALPWLYLVHRATGGQWLNDFFYIHHLRRYTAGFGHRQPFYYYFLTLPVDFLPWTIFAVPALIAGRNIRRAWSQPHIQLCFLWFLTVFLFFSASDTKRDLYLLPLMPTLALLVANYLDDLHTRSLVPNGVLYLTIIFFGVLAAAGLAGPVAAWIGWRDSLWPILPVSVVLAAGGALAVLLIRCRRMLAASASVSGMMWLMTMALALWFFPYLERFKSPRPFALEIRQIVPASAPLYVYGDRSHDFNFYAQREEIPVLTTPAQIKALRGEAEKSYLLISGRDLKRIWDLVPEWVIVGASDRTDWNLVELGAVDSQTKQSDDMKR